jgi:hypothetical protein
MYARIKIQDTYSIRLSLHISSNGISSIRMIKKLTTTLPNFVHTILAKLNKDDPRGEERGAPANSSSSSSSKPVPSAKQAKNPFFLSRDYLDHTLEAISAKTGT